MRDKYPEVKLLFSIYVDDPAGTKKFLHRVTELGLDNNVEYLGCLPKEELPLCYSAADYVCQPSINQPSNGPLKEALHCETPIIAGVESEEVREFQNGCRIDVRNADASAEKIVELIKNRGSLDLRTYGSDLMQSYSLESSLVKFEKIIQQAGSNQD